MNNFKKKIDVSGGEGFKFDNVGDTLTGFYLGSFPHEGNYAPTTKHLFKTERGILTIFGQRHLTSLLEGEKTGVLMQVTYSGTKASKKKGYAPMKMYELGIDASQSLDAAELGDAAEAANAGQEEDFGNDDGDDTTYDEVQTAPARPALAAQSPSKDKVNAVLAKLGGRKSA